jgi:serine phosphatase RsbU (regulator of sigma subunit)
MTALVIFTIAGNSLQFSKTFLEYQQRALEDQIVSDAEKANNQFVQVIETWKSQVAVALPTLRGVDNKKSASLIKNFVESSPEFISFDIIEAPNYRSRSFKNLGSAFTSDSKDRRWEGNDPKALASTIKRSAMRFLKRTAPKSKKSQKVYIHTLAPETKLPIMVVLARFRIASSATTVWAVLTTWQSNLIKSLPKSRFITASVIDHKGRIFTSHSTKEMKSRSPIRRNSIVSTALAGKTPSGFQPEFLKNGRRTLGGFSRVSDYGLTVIVEQDAEKSYEMLKKNVLGTALWALLFILLAIMFSFLGAAGITKGLRAVTVATTRIASGDFGFRVPQRSGDEVGLLSHSVNQMSSKIVQLMRSQVDKARFEKELETAKMVQSTFFPKKDILTGNLKVTGFYQPASECGGDLWGHYNIKEGVDFVYIADATGHGAPAALVTAIAYSTTTTIGDIVKSQSGAHEPPSKILERLNRIIFEAVEGKICMTFFGAIIDTTRGKITFANAGHNFPVLLPGDPGDNRAKKVPKSLKKLSDIPPVSLNLKGTPLGLDAASTYKDKEMDLRHGDKIFFFTDGLIECQSPNGEVWGRKVLLENIVENAKRDCKDLKTEVLSRAFEFFADKELDDDVTVVVAEVDRVWSVKEDPVPSSTSEATSPRPAPIQAPKASLPTAPTPEAPVPNVAAASEADLNSSPSVEIKLADTPAPPTPESRQEIEIEYDSSIDIKLSDNFDPEQAQEDLVPVTKTATSAEPQSTSGKRKKRGKFKIKLPSAG